MNTYYLWDDNVPYRPIVIGDSVTKTSESHFLVIVQRYGLEAALKELSEKATRNGKKRHLEVHCHGLPGGLSLGKDYAVSNSDVHIFGAWLRNAIHPGGFIELLACLVASQGEDMGRRLRQTPITNIAGYREDYHGVIRREERRKYSKPSIATGVRSRNPVSDQQGKPLSKGLVFKPEDPLKENPQYFFTPDPDTDGLKFCLALARTSLCRVRAAITIQIEEDYDDGPFNNPIGNWENEVFDFYPNGQIKFVGNSPYRGPKMRSYDMGRSMA